ncbi:MAG: 23S rRNA (guanosine(2251)-2'-O)-methyltransferase RlmB [Bacteroidales bacterium]|nr:23S rRNA (guanosine(2251)-2'-O)-methyltransferase RlmB [Bacteroidales bacterium]
MNKTTSFIYGLRPVIEAIREGRHIDCILIRHGLQGQVYHELMKEIRAHGIPYQFVPVERIDFHTNKNHQGVLALISLIEYQEINNIVPAIYEKGEEPLIICLDGVSDVRNFGAIVRSAACMGAHAIMIPEKGSAGITADSIKTSAGALANFPVCRVKSIIRGVTYLKESGLKIVCAEEKSGMIVYKSDLTGPVAIIMGSEERGIRKELLALADMKVKIPITGTIGSLNVSVAAGILLYEISRQRSK